MSRTSCSKRCGELSSLKVTSALPLPSKYAASLTHVWISVGFPLLQSRNTEGYYTINHSILHTYTHTHIHTYTFLDNHSRVHRRVGPAMGNTCTHYIHIHTYTHTHIHLPGQPLQSARQGRTSHGKHTIHTYRYGLLCTGGRLFQSYLNFETWAFNRCSSTTGPRSTA